MPRTEAARDWRPGIDSEGLRRRATVLARIRDFFRRRGVMEVDTPVLASAAGTDPAIEPLHTVYTGPDAPAGQALYLQSSPEFFMKRLLAAGSGPIYQLSHVFRDGERGTRHNPEFMMLEWYRPGYDLAALMDEVDSLLGEVLQGLLDYRPARRIRYHDWFIEGTGLDPWSDGVEAFRAFARKHCGAPPALDDDLDGWLDLLVSHWLEPRLDAGEALFVFDYPPSQASLARRRPGPPDVAERFELYLGGLELANGFHELADPVEQAQRFAQDNAVRERRGQAAMPVDTALIAALEQGLPDCSGVALGVDRLLMVANGATDIAAVMPFDLGRV